MHLFKGPLSDIEVKLRFVLLFLCAMVYLILYEFWLFIVKKYIFNHSSCIYSSYFGYKHVLFSLFLFSCFYYLLCGHTVVFYYGEGIIFEQNFKGNLKCDLTLQREYFPLVYGWSRLCYWDIIAKVQWWCVWDEMRIYSWLCEEL